MTPPSSSPYSGDARANFPVNNPFPGNPFPDHFPLSSSDVRLDQNRKTAGATDYARGRSFSGNQKEPLVPENARSPFLPNSVFMESQSSEAKLPKPRFTKTKRRVAPTVNSRESSRGSPESSVLLQPNLGFRSSSIPNERTRGSAMSAGGRENTERDFLGGIGLRDGVQESRSYELGRGLGIGDQKKEFARSVSGDQSLGNLMGWSNDDLFDDSNGLDSKGFNSFDTRNSNPSKFGDSSRSVFGDNSTAKTVSFGAEQRKASGFTVENNRAFVFDGGNAVFDDVNAKTSVSNEASMAGIGVQREKVSSFIGRTGSGVKLSESFVFGGRSKSSFVAETSSKDRMNEYAGRILPEQIGKLKIDQRDGKGSPTGGRNLSNEMGKLNIKTMASDVDFSSSRGLHEETSHSLPNEMRKLKIDQMADDSIGKRDWRSTPIVKEVSENKFFAFGSRGTSSPMVVGDYAMGTTKEQHSQKIGGISDQGIDRNSKRDDAGPGNFRDVDDISQEDIRKKLASKLDQKSNKTSFSFNAGQNFSDGYANQNKSFTHPSGTRLPSFPYESNFDEMLQTRNASMKNPTSEFSKIESKFYKNVGVVSSGEVSSFSIDGMTSSASGEGFYAQSIRPNLDSQRYEQNSQKSDSVSHKDPQVGKTFGRNASPSVVFDVLKQNRVVSGPNKESPIPNVKPPGLSSSRSSSYLNDEMNASVPLGTSNLVSGDRVPIYPKPVGLDFEGYSSDKKDFIFESSGVNASTSKEKMASGFDKLSSGSQSFGSAVGVSIGQLPSLGGKEPVEASRFMQESELSARNSAVHQNVFVFGSTSGNASLNSRPSSQDPVGSQSAGGVHGVSEPFIFGKTSQSSVFDGTPVDDPTSKMNNQMKNLNIEGQTVDSNELNRGEKSKHVAFAAFRSQRTSKAHIHHRRGHAGQTGGNALSSDGSVDRGDYASRSSSASSSIDEKISMGPSSAKDVLGGFRFEAGGAESHPSSYHTVGSLKSSVGTDFSSVGSDFPLNSFAQQSEPYNLDTSSCKSEDQPLHDSVSLSESFSKQFQFHAKGAPSTSYVKPKKNKAKQKKSYTTRRNQTSVSQERDSLENSEFDTADGYSPMDISPYPESPSHLEQSKETSATSGRSLGVGLGNIATNYAVSSEERDVRLNCMSQPQANKEVEGKGHEMPSVEAFEEAMEYSERIAMGTECSVSSQSLGSRVESNESLSSLRPENKRSESREAALATHTSSDEQLHTDLGKSSKVEVGHSDKDAAMRSDFSLKEEDLGDTKFTFSASSSEHILKDSPRRKYRMKTARDTLASSQNTDSYLGLNPAGLGSSGFGEVPGSVRAVPLPTRLSGSQQLETVEKQSLSAAASSTAQQFELPAANIKQISGAQGSTLFPFTVNTSAQTMATSISGTEAEEVCEKWRLRGNQAYIKGDLAKAEEYYTRGIDSLFSSGMPIKTLVLCYSNRAATRMSLDRIGEALGDCIKAIEIDGTFLKVQIRAANCYLALGKIEDATTLFIKCLQSGKNSSSDAKIAVEASEGLDKVQQLSRYMDQIAKCLGQKASDEAESILQVTSKALLLSPACDQLYEMKAEALFMLRKYEEVNQLCEQTLGSIERNYNGVDFQSGLKYESCRTDFILAKVWRGCMSSRCYFSLGRLEDALELLRTHDIATLDIARLSDRTREFLTAYPNVIRELLHLKSAGNEAFQIGKHSEAVDHYTNALAYNTKSRPFSAICFCNRAAAYQALGQITDAIADCSLAIALDANYPKALSRRATLHEMIRDYGQAATDLHRLVDLLGKQTEEKPNNAGASGKPWGVMNDLKQVQRRLATVQEEARRDISLDVYLILGIESSCTASEIKKAYRKAALKHHPDKAGQFFVRSENSNDRIWQEISEEVYRDADRLFKMIGEAYAVVSDPSKRLQYDSEEEIRKDLKRAGNSSFSGHGGYSYYDTGSPVRTSRSTTRPGSGTQYHWYERTR